MIGNYGIHLTSLCQIPSAFQARKPRIAHPHPGGMADNSPTFQRWGCAFRGAQVPKGRLKPDALRQPSLRDLSCRGRGLAASSSARLRVQRGKLQAQDGPGLGGRETRPLRLDGRLDANRDPNSQHPTANSQQPTPNSQQPTPNSQHPTANSQQPTPNSQQPMLTPTSAFGCWMLDVGCSRNLKARTPYESPPR